MASSITQAREGTLYLMVGGKPEAHDRALPVLEQMSKELRYVGPSGTVAQVKALVNMVMNINTAGLAEGLGLADALDLAKQAGLTLPLAQATKRQFDRMVDAGLGELDKSGIAELTFPGRGPGTA